jgi:hypothetical protein
MQPAIPTHLLLYSLLLTAFRMGAAAPAGPNLAAEWRLASVPGTWEDTAQTIYEGSPGIAAS